MENWFSADYHFGHTNILRLCKRQFLNIHHMRDCIIANHNSVVAPNDKHWILGDFAYRCSAQYAVECLERMNGFIHLIFGNHDKPLRQAWRKGLLDKMVSSKKLTIYANRDRKQIISLDLKMDGQRIIVSHYAMRSWPGAFKGSWHIYGHSHGNLSSYFRSFDCGIDTSKYFPYKFEQIKLRMDAVNIDFKESHEYIESTEKNLKT